MAGAARKQVIETMAEATTAMAEAMAAMADQGTTKRKTAGTSTGSLPYYAEARKKRR